ncbi:hypothetical protein APHAL10511_005727 [Amanita phalloides]|nr:hypothetical protein APHAL10511_005727 [Amanita phalloides]
MLPAINTGVKVTRKHPLDHDDASRTNKMPRQSPNLPVAVTTKAERSIQVMRENIEKVYSYKISESEWTLLLWSTACTKVKNQEDSWMSDELELLNARLPKDAYLSETYNDMFEAFCSQKPRDQKEAERILDAIPNMEQMITKGYDDKKRDCMEILRRWRVSWEAWRDGIRGRPYSLHERLPDEDPILQYCNDQYESFVHLVGRISVPDTGIYSSCTLYPRHNCCKDTHPSGSSQGRLEFKGNGQLEFHRMLMSDFLVQRRPLFIAALYAGRLSVSQVFVKLTDDYDEDVHQLLEEENLAPKLYAKSSEFRYVSPTAYIMEYLKPSSWKTLRDYASLAEDLDYKEPVRLSMDKVLTILRKNKVVHGDLRPPNIMIQVSPKTGKLVCVDDEGSQRASIRVIDFDWSGEAGKVYYPGTRNEDIPDITWSGKPGYPIEQDHDEQLFQSWWPNLGKEVKDESGLQSNVSQV